MEGMFHGFGTARAAEAVLRAVGATTVHVIRLATLTGTEQQRELGQTQPQYDDVAIAPAAVKTESTAPATLKVNAILPGLEVRKHAEAEGAESGTAWLLSARGILYEGTLLRISQVQAEVMGGVEFLYYVTAEV